jgi:hypothetical protein
VTSVIGLGVVTARCLGCSSRSRSMLRRASMRPTVAQSARALVFLCSSLVWGCGGSIEHGTMNASDSAVGDAACSPPLVDPTTCSPDDLSAAPIVQQTFTTSAVPMPNNLPIPPGMYQLTATTAYCPPGSSGYPMARYKQAVASITACSIRVTFRGDVAKAALQADAPTAGVIGYSGTQGTRVCPTPSGGASSAIPIAWTVTGSTLIVPNSEVISAMLLDGGAGTCESVDTLQKM